MSRLNVLTQLKSDLARLQGLSASSPQARVSTGIAALDSLLPAGGVRAGSLIEWISGGAGGGATTLALGAAAVTCSHERPLVVIDGRGELYPPALCTHFAPMTNDARHTKRGAVLMIRPCGETESLWAMEQVLRCPAVSLMLGRTGYLSDRAARRLLLAAEQGACAGMLIRPASEERSPCWAEARFRVDPIATGGRRRLRVSLLRCRGGQPGASIVVELGDEASVVRLAPEVAAAAPVHRAEGA